VTFWDASAVVPLCLHEPRTSRLRRLVRQHGRQVVWWGTPVEVHGALARMVRDRVFTEPARDQASARLEVLRRAWFEVQPTERLRSLAEMLPSQFDLRAGDALQLAAALVWSRERPRGRVFVCLDRRLSEAADRLGYSVISDV
jgi:predicted nucleic acid-binding protein